MATAELNRNPANAQPDSTPNPPGRVAKFLLLIVALAFCATAFLTLDFFRTAAIERRHIAKLAANPDPCRQRDPIRHHVFQPNCTAVNYWGADEYKIFTNSLGMRDERIRAVPLADPRPRILILGDSYTEGKAAWSKTFPGRIAAQFPQYDFLNGAVDGYSPSNYLNTTRAVLDEGVEIDEVIVFLDNSAVQLEAAFYRDVDDDGAVTAIPPEEQHSAASWYGRFRKWVGHHFALTYQALRFAERVQGPLVRHGFYHLPGDYFGDPFDAELTAWSYRKVNETEPFAAGYAPLGVAGGTARAEAKMSLLWEELAKRNIPLTVVVYPQLAQVVHDTADSREVELWRRWCEGKCKRFVSVFPQFYAARNACPPSQPGCWYAKLFIFGDIHYNANGNALVADAVTQSLMTEPAMKARHLAGLKPGASTAGRFHRLKVFTAQNNHVRSTLYNRTNEHSAFRAVRRPAAPIQAGAARRLGRLLPAAVSGARLVRHLRHPSPCQGHRRCQHPLPRR